MCCVALDESPLMQRLLFALLLSVCLGAMAAEPASPVVRQSTIDGDWLESVERVDIKVPGFDGETLQLHGSVPGSGSTLLLHTRGSNVTGSGTYRMEAGPSGTLTVSGRYLAPELTLTITSDRGQVSTYTARVLDARHIKGIRSYKEYGASEVSFVRP
jgi:hypothetical protein